MSKSIPNQNIVEELLTNILKAIVDKPSDIVVAKSNKDSNGEIKLMIACSTDDIGKIIGKKGATISSLKTIIRVIGIKQYKKKYKLELTEYA